MARIPMGDYGQATPNLRQTPINSPPPGAFGGDVARSLESVGQTGMALAGQAIRQDAMDAKQAQREADAELKQQLREAEAMRKEADRAKALTALNGTRDQLQDLHDATNEGVVNGTIDKTQAEASFTEQSKKLLEQTSKNLPDEHRDVAMANLGGYANRLSNGVRKAVTQRDRQDVTASIGQNLEYLQRQYAKDPVGATAQAMQTIDSLGQFSTLLPDALQKLKQNFKEGSQFTAAYTMVSNGKDSRTTLAQVEKAINNGFPDLDPQKKAQLIDRVQAYNMRLDQKDEMAANRAQREAERRLHQAEAQYNVFQSMADKGAALDPQYIDQTLQLTAGTPYAAGIKALAQQAKDNGGLAAQPVAVQQATLDAINTEIAKNGRNPGLDKRKDQIEKVLRGSQSDVKADALRAGLERGVITDLKPLDMTHGIPGVVQQLAARIPQAQTVSQWSGRQVSPLLESEAISLKTSLDALPAKERSNAVAMLAGAIGPQAAQGIAAQLDGKDKGLALAFAYSGASTTAGRLTSELIFKGRQAEKDGTSTRNEKQAEMKPQQWSAHIADAIEGAYPAQTMTDNVRQSALLIAHGLASEAGGQLSTNDLDRAVRLAVGGPVIDYNGRKVPLPAGVDESMLNQRLGAMTAEELRKQAPDGKVLAGGQPVPVAEFAKSLRGQQLMYAGPGKFNVIVGGRPVLNSAGKRITIGVE